MPACVINVKNAVAKFNSSQTVVKLSIFYYLKDYLCYYWTGNSCNFLGLFVFIISLQNIYIKNTGKDSINKCHLGIKIVTLRILLIVMDDTGIFLDHRNLVRKSTYSGVK